MDFISYSRSYLYK